MSGSIRYRAVLYVVLVHIKVRTYRWQRVGCHRAQWRNATNTREASDEMNLYLELCAFLLLLLMAILPNRHVHGCVASTC
jgi:hypothetical protein